MTAADFYLGTGDGTDATRLQTSIITPSASVGTVTSSGTALNTYLNAQYGVNGANIGNFVFLRLSPDNLPTFNSGQSYGYQVGFQDNGTSGNRPFVTYTAIPEPSTSMLLGGLGMLALLRRRRTA